MLSHAIAVHRFSRLAPPQIDTLLGSEKFAADLSDFVVRFHQITAFDLLLTFFGRSGASILITKIRQFCKRVLAIQL